MPTIIDSLIVSLGLESKAFSTGARTAQAAFNKTKNEAVATGNEIEARGKQAALFFSKLRNEALTFFAVFTAGVGLKNFVTDTIDGAASLGRMSANLDMSTRRLASWQRANERAGGSAAGITDQLKESAAESAKYRTGGNAATIAAFGKYGGDFAELKDGNSYLLARSKILAALYKVDASRAAVAAQELGISEDTFNLLKQGPDAVQKLIDAQMKNAVVTEKDAAEADKLRIKLLDLRDTLVGTGTQILLTLSPVLERLLQHFQNLATWVADNREEIAAWLESAVEWFKAFAEGADTAAEAVGGWKVVLLALIGLKIGGLAMQFLALASAIAAVGTASKGAAAAGAAGGSLMGFLGRLSAGAALLLHSGDLNSGEDAELARRRALGGGTPAASGSAWQKVMDSLQAKGWTREQAAGMAANLQAESNYDPTAVGDGGKAYGIAQWHPDRQAAFKKKFGYDIRQSSLEDQLEFMDHELREGGERKAGDRLRKETTSYGAAMTVSDYYERPSDALGDKAIARARIAEGIDAAEKARMAAWAAANPEFARSSGAGGGGVAGAGGGSSKTDIQIDTINVQTQATDAQGIANSIGSAMQNNSLIQQANTGLE